MAASPHGPLTGGPALVVALTGGIGSGKSLVTECFARRGVPIIDADVLSRELTAPGSPLNLLIDASIGPGLLGADGGLDRPRVRALVFADEERRRALEQIIHPRVEAEVERRIQRLGAVPYCVVSIPLLIETGQANRGWRVLVVDAPESLQVTRTAARDGLPAPAVRAIMASQATRAERLAAAHDVIENECTAEALDVRVGQLHRQYLELAGCGVPSSP